MDVARRELYDVVLLDTAGRLAIDDALMAEVAAVKAATTPHQTLLVVDAMTGQDAVNTARASRTHRHHRHRDDTGRRRCAGGAALSMRAVTGAPIVLLGAERKAEALEFHPERIANRIPGMGDIVSLVERAAEAIDREEAEKLAAKMQRGGFDLEDYRKQLQQISKMGSLEASRPAAGAGRIKQQLAEASLDTTILKRQVAIISSMTMAERRNPEIIKASRKRRIAAGSGTTVQEVSRLLKQFDEMSAIVKRMNKLGQKGLMRGGLSALLPGLSNRRPF